MMMRVLVLFFACGLSAPAFGQSLTIGGAIQHDIQRFEGDASLNRFDGNALGWMIIGGARIHHWVVRGEVLRDETIRSTQSLTLTVRGQPTTITSELSHDLGEIAVLGGYARDLGSRVEAALVGGIAVVTVDRAFTTDAGQLVLIPPSTVPPAAVTTTLVDRFTVWTAEATATVHATRRVGIVGGVRIHPMSLADDLSGRSVRTFVGLVWRFK